ncbi:hypothetical protein ACLOJK_034046 [Asimina triloba]
MARRHGSSGGIVLQERRPRAGEQGQRLLARSRPRLGEPASSDERMGVGSDGHDRPPHLHGGRTSVDEGEGNNKRSQPHDLDPTPNHPTSRCPAIKATNRNF